VRSTARLQNAIGVPAVKALDARTAAKVKELFADVHEELRLKKIELNRAETRVHNFIEFIASGRASPTLADALSAWITNRIGKLNHLLATRTEKSARGGQALLPSPGQIRHPQLAG
jgi:hypothetical protein